MLHAMKGWQDQLYTGRLQASECVGSKWKIRVKTNKYVNNIKHMKQVWKKMDEESLKLNYSLETTDISECWPNCPENFEYIPKAL